MDVAAQFVPIEKIESVQILNVNTRSIQEIKGTAPPASSCCKENSDTNNHIEIESEKIWTSENVKMLIDLYKKYSAESEKGLKKNFWKKISNLLNENNNVQVNAQQCDTKWKGLVKTYKNIKKYNDTSGNNPKFWKYYDELDSILFKKPEINAVCTFSSASGLNVNESQINLLPPSQPKRKCKVDTDAERRHQEKLQRQDRFLDLLEDLTKKFKKE